MGSRKQLKLNLALAKETAPPVELPEFNLVLLGALGVGKSALTVKYITRRFIMEYDPFMEDTYSKDDCVDGQDMLVRVMDTCDEDDQVAGDADPASGAERYTKWAHGFIVVYSITSRQSFDTAKSYLESVTQCQRDGAKDPPIALVGNKMDLERYRTVSVVAGEELAAKYDCLFYETSAAEDYASVELVFHNVLREICGLSLPPLFISEDGKGTGTGGRGKSPSADTGRRMTGAPTPKRIPSRTPSTFKIFNKSFKIFN